MLSRSRGNSATATDDIVLDASTEYGATGNGTTNDAPSIQAALTAAGTASAATGRPAKVYLSAGTYLVKATLSIPANVILEGDGDSTVIKLGGDSYDLLTEVDCTPVLLPATLKPILCPSQTGGPHAGIVIRNLKIDGNGADQDTAGAGVTDVSSSATGGSYAGILTQNSDKMIIDGVNVVDVVQDLNITGSRRAFCLAIINSTNTVVRSSRFFSAGYDTVTVRGYLTTSAHISDCFIGDGGRTALQVYDDGPDTTVVNCKIDNTASNGTSAGGVFFHGAVRPKLIGCTILADVSNCIAIFGDNDVGSRGAAPRYSEDVLIQGCTLIYTGTTNAALAFTDGGDGYNYTKRVLIQGNHIQQAGGSSSSQAGVRIPTGVANGVSVVGNMLFSDTNGPAISVGACEQIIVSDNQVTMTYTAAGTAGYAASFSGTLAPAIRGNIFNVDDPGTDVLVLATLVGGVVEGNICNHTSGSQPTACVPIRINGCDYLTVSNNDFRSGCNTAAIYIENDCDNLIVTGNRVGPGPNLATNPSYGIRCPGTGNGFMLIANNDLLRVVNGSFSTTFVIGTGSRVYGNLTSTSAGDKHDQDSGTATIPNSGTTALIAVTHKVTQARTFTAADVVVTPTSDLGDATNFWVDTFTAGGFTINVNADPNAAVTFAWSISLANRAP